jgi:hypothetical protein
MTTDPQAKAFGIIVASVIVFALIAAFAKFFADDRKRVEVAQKQQQDVEQPYRNALGEFADIDAEHMTSEIEAKMTGLQKKQWAEFQALKGIQEKRQGLSLDLFGSMSSKDKLKRFAKMLGISMLLLLAYIASLTIDDALGLKSLRFLPVSFVVAVLLYLAFVIVRAKRSLR